MIVLGDRPVVAQFAARNPIEFSKSIEYIAPYVDAVDLNCGCPQRWAIEEGIGSALLDDWSRLEQIVKAGIEASRPYNLPVSVKIRIFPEIDKTIELARRLERLGVAWITVHGRTKAQKPCAEPDYAQVRLVKECLSIPVIANGNVFSLEDAERIQKETGVNGVMAARGLMENPGLFYGLPETNWEVIDTYIKAAVQHGTTTAIFHHHLATMIENSKCLTKSQHRILNGLANSSIPSIIDYLDQFRPHKE